MLSHRRLPSLRRNENFASRGTTSILPAMLYFY
jgi:hypothetical protein